MEEEIQVKKRILKKELLLYPCPILLVTSKWKNIRNVLTVSWSGIASSHPEYITISINKKRYSHSLIVNSGALVVNIINEDLINAADYCGSHSGKSIDKFDDCRLATSSGTFVDAPLIDNCPINIECKVENIIDLGSHDLIVGKVLVKWINSDIADDDLHEKLRPAVYFRPYYYRLNDTILGEYR